MQYKTIVLELLQQIPELHDRLRESRALLPTMERLAGELKDSHERWKTVLARTSPDHSEAQISSAALEVALKELEISLLPDSHGANEPPSPDGATAHPRRHSPPA